MKKYKCLRCGYETEVLCNFNRHLSRKNICKPLIKNVNLSECQNELFNICNFCGIDYELYSNKENHNNQCLVQKEKLEKEKLENEELKELVTELKTFLKETSH